MRILHLETGRHLYGGPRQVLYLLDALAATGEAGTLVCPEGSAIAKAARAGGHDVRTLPLGGDLDVRTVGRITTLLRTLRPDLVHVHSRRGADFFGGIAARLGRVPAVLTRRVDNADTPVVGTWKYRAYARIVAVSEAVAARLLAEGVPPEQLEVIHSAVRPADCAPAGDRDSFLASFGLPTDALVVAMVAQFIPRKGHARLLDAWPLIREAQPRARLLLLGEGPLLEPLAERVHGDPTIAFAGFREDAARLIGHCEVLAHPAQTEGLGVAVLEAQAAGVPVVTCAAGGLPEVIEDRVTGRLVDGDDAMQLADAVLALLGDAALRARLGAAGRERVTRRFAVEHMASAYRAVYARVLEGDA